MGWKETQVVVKSQSKACLERTYVWHRIIHSQAGGRKKSLAQGKSKAGGGKETHPKIQGQN